MISWWRTSFGELEIQKLAESVSLEHISQGPVTEQLEAELGAALDVPYVVATTSGSAALLMALMAVGVGRDDEVVVPNRTWVASAHGALLIGAKVVLVDVRPDIPAMDTEDVKKHVTPRTKAIMPVHLNGRAVDMKAVHVVARHYGLYVIEDACQALFSRGSGGMLGTQSDVGCFSLGTTKLISTGQGGFAVTRDQRVYERLKLIRNHGVVDMFTETWNQLGFNFKFTDLLASFGIVQLSKASVRMAHLERIYLKYCEGLAELPCLRILPVAVDAGELPLYVEVMCPQRERLREFLHSHGIETRPVPPSLSISEYIPHASDYPNSKVFAQQGMYLPCGPEQPLENVDRVLEILWSYR